MNTSSASAGELLREVARLYTRAQRLVADCCQTTPTQCHILTELARAGVALPMSELGTRLLLEKSWVSRAVEGLAAKGLVLKTDNPVDARSWLVGLSPAGEARVSELNGLLDGHAEQLLATLAAPQREAVQTALLLLLKTLRADHSAMCCLPASERNKDG
ncbi:MarR family transcriptional regulator [Paucibacter sp. O1-1]|uniref:MarR family winged helix-turn-helix transcriptional regulator n=1 Tax=Paucibacter sp. XJ19-41 TaxID=2927824 RepID=UPI0021D500A3|nr:MarR family transcriptional regulator [Paucibacter sp. XJ19-41]MCU7369698.1 MarR family transcriptional regulator [Paucibacter sp. O1-1]MDA3824683.1 MarR family transcriptional regulator [Paucibacter sp. O1-1]MDC6166333.1 MarR family transcriptional regulator [Paucibacter sp. XJ19-41]